MQRKGLLAAQSGRLQSPSTARQGVAQTGRNCTGPPCSVGRPTATRPAADCPCARQPACPLAGSITNNDRRRQTTDTSQQNNTGPLGGPVIYKIAIVAWSTHSAACRKSTLGLFDAVNCNPTVHAPFQKSCWSCSIFSLSLGVLWRWVAPVH